MADEVHGWISEGESREPAIGAFRRLPVLLAASAVVGAVAGAALTRAWEHDYLPFPPSPTLDLQVTAGATEAWIAVPDRGAGGIAIIPLVMSNKGNQSIILDQVRVAGVATRLSTDPTYNITGEIPETLRPGVFSSLQVPVAFDCSENVQPDPVVTLVARRQAGAE